MGINVSVLILVLVEEGLGGRRPAARRAKKCSLNPCFSGGRSRRATFVSKCQRDRCNEIFRFVNFLRPKICTFLRVFIIAKLVIFAEKSRENTIKSIYKKNRRYTVARMSRPCRPCPGWPQQCPPGVWYVAAAVVWYVAAGANYCAPTQTHPSNYTTTEHQITRLPVVCTLTSNELC